MQSEWLDVQIPAGVADGSRVRVAGARQRGTPRRARRATSCWRVHVEPHPFFRREGEDLHCEVPVTHDRGGARAHTSRCRRRTAR